LSDPEALAGREKRLLATAKNLDSVTGAAGPVIQAGMHGYNAIDGNAATREMKD